MLNCWHAKGILGACPAHTIQTLLKGIFFHYLFLICLLFQALLFISKCHRIIACGTLRLSGTLVGKQRSTHVITCIRMPWPSPSVHLEWATHKTSSIWDGLGKPDAAAGGNRERGKALGYTKTEILPISHSDHMNCHNHFPP